MMSIKNIVLALGLASTSSAVRLQSQSIFDDIGDWTSGAVHSAKKWTEGAADSASHAVDSASKWTEGAVNDTGKFLDHEKDTITSAVVGAVTADGLRRLGTEAGEAAEHAVV